MFGPSIIVAKAAQLWADQVGGDGIRGVSQRAAEVSSLCVVAHQDQSHIRYEPDVFNTLLVIIRQSHRAA